MEWKVIEECPNYSVSNEGDVRSNVTGNIVRCDKGCGWTLSLNNRHKYFSRTSLLSKYWPDQWTQWPDGVDRPDSVEWRKVDGYDYSISNQGHLRNDKRGKVLNEPKDGHWGWSVWVNGASVFFGRLELMRTYWKYEWIKELEDDEEATPIKGHPDYFITNKGRVFSLVTYSFLNPTKVRGQYYYAVNLTSPNGPKGYDMHTLVGRHFLQGYKPGDQILHNKETLPYPEINYISNLRIGNYTQNAEDIFIKDRNGRALSVDQVKSIRRLSQEGHSGAEIARELGVKPNRVYNVITGQTFSYIQ